MYSELTINALEKLPSSQHIFGSHYSKAAELIIAKNVVLANWPVIVRYFSYFLKKPVKKRIMKRYGFAKQRHHNSITDAWLNPSLIQPLFFKALARVIAVIGKTAPNELMMFSLHQWLSTLGRDPCTVTRTPRKVMDTDTYIILLLLLYYYNRIVKICANILYSIF